MNETTMTHQQAYSLLRFLFRKKDGNQIFEESEYNHYFLGAVRIFYPEIDDLWRVANAKSPTKNTLEARKKIGQIFIDIGKTLDDTL